MAGNCSMARAMGRLSLARERVDSKTPLIVPTPRIHLLRYLNGSAGKVRKYLHRGNVTRPSPRASPYPISCGRVLVKTLQIVCFSLVTLKCLLY